MSFINKSKAKAYVNELGYRAGQEALMALNQEVELLLKAMCTRAKLNHRTTIMRGDV